MPGVAGDLVRSRSRQGVPSDVVEGRRGWHCDGAPLRELVRELRVRGREVERDRVGGVVVNDPAAQIAVARLRDAVRGADDAEEGWQVEFLSRSEHEVSF